MLRLIERTKHLVVVLPLLLVRLQDLQSETLGRQGVGTIEEHPNWGEAKVKDFCLGREGRKADAGM